MNATTRLQPLLPLSPASSAAFARRKEAGSPSVSRAEYRVYKTALESVHETKQVQDTTAASRAAAVKDKHAKDLKDSAWKKYALMTAHKGATIVSGGDLRRVGDELPVLQGQRLDGPRAHQTIETRVLHLLEPISAFLVKDINPRIRQPSRGPSARAFVLEEMMAILDMLLEEINGLSGAENGRDYLDMHKRLAYYVVDGAWKRVSRFRFQLFRKLLQFNPHDLCQALNDVLLDTVSLHTARGSVMFISGDESMIPGDFDSSVYVPRKPQPLGMRLHVLAARLTETGRPVVLYVLPDFARRNDSNVQVGNVHKPMEVLERFRLWYVANRTSLPEHVWITVDSLFSYPSMLDAWEAVGLHGSMALRAKIYTSLCMC